MMGNRVLLVDANLRSPQLHNKLELANFKGLSDILISGANAEPIIQQSSLSENLFVLAAGQPTPEAVRLLASNRMQNLMDKLRSTFDLVIYDTPHLAGLTDASFLAPYTDGVLMVVSPTRTNQSALLQAHSELRNFGISELGVVINHQSRHSKSNHISYSRNYVAKTGMNGRMSQPLPEPESVS